VNEIGLLQSYRIGINDNPKHVIGELGQMAEREKDQHQAYKGYSFFDNQTLFGLGKLNHNNHGIKML
jgi:hypothetical protein